MPGSSVPRDVEVQAVAQAIDDHMFPEHPWAVDPEESPQPRTVAEVAIAALDASRAEPREEDRNWGPEGGMTELEWLRSEVESLKGEGRAKHMVLKQRTDELDALRDYCKRQGILAADLPVATSFDRELRRNLEPREGASCICPMELVARGGRKVRCPVHGEGEADEREARRVSRVVQSWPTEHQREARKSASGEGKRARWKLWVCDGCGDWSECEPGDLCEVCREGHVQVVEVMPVAESERLLAEEREARTRDEREAGYHLRAAFDAAHPGYGSAMFGEMAEGIVDRIDSADRALAEERDKTHRLEKALEAIVAATEDDTGHEPPVEPGDCAACDALRIARAALSGEHQ